MKTALSANERGSGWVDGSLFTDGILLDTFVRGIDIGLTAHDRAQCTTASFAYNGSTTVAQDQDEPAPYVVVTGAVLANPVATAGTATYPDSTLALSHQPSGAWVTYSGFGMSATFNLNLGSIPGAVGIDGLVLQASGTSLIPDPNARDVSLIQDPTLIANRWVYRGTSRQLVIDFDGGDTIPATGYTPDGIPVALISQGCASNYAMTPRSLRQL